MDSALDACLAQPLGISWPFREFDGMASIFGDNLTSKIDLWCPIGCDTVDLLYDSTHAWGSFPTVFGPIATISVRFGLVSNSFSCRLSWSAKIRLAGGFNFRA